MAGWAPPPRVVQHSILYRVKRRARIIRVVDATEQRACKRNVRETPRGDRVDERKKEKRHSPVMCDGFARGRPVGRVCVTNGPINRNYGRTGSSPNDERERPPPFGYENITPRLAPTTILIDRSMIIDLKSVHSVRSTVFELKKKKVHKSARVLSPSVLLFVWFFFNPSRRYNWSVSSFFVRRKIVYNPTHTHIHPPAA